MTNPQAPAPSFLAGQRYWGTGNGVRHALLEAVAAVMSHVPGPLKEGMFVVGSTTLCCVDLQARCTSVIDLAVTSAALGRFITLPMPIHDSLSVAHIRIFLRVSGGRGCSPNLAGL